MMYAFLIFFLSITQVCAQNANSFASVSLLALGDVNLGRAVGQEILKGNLDYPFEKFDDVLKRGEIIFANLECPVTDQNGETQSPKSNVVFCAPPKASLALRQAGVTVVSTANNHAFDYGFKGLRETIKFLNQDSINYTGTIADTGREFVPVIIERKGIKIGIIAYTQTVNMVRGTRSGLISIFDSARAQHEIGTLRNNVDFILVSYHGGDEYKDVLSQSAEREMNLLADFGANVILGHHSHVPQGIEIYNGCLMFHSLGNAVFNQPQRFWTQRSFAALIEFEKRNEQKKISSIELIPFRTGFQPVANLNADDEEKLMDRIQTLSTITITHTERGYFVEQSVLPVSH
jgi:poly-gamma-glutamate capsule biosynthesis protein CapA/YwtB (metallophosphatase superfamily)